MKTNSVADSKLQPFGQYVSRSLPRVLVVQLAPSYRPITTDWGDVPANHETVLPLFRGVPTGSLICCFGETAVN